MALPDISAGNTGHIVHHNALHDWTQDDEQIRYVSSKSRASDSIDGRTPFQPMATLSTAIASLPNTAPNYGGTVYLGAGDFTLPTGGLTISTRGVSIQGIGPRPTRLLVPAAAP
jgi:hypothetical protein